MRSLLKHPLILLAVAFLSALAIRSVGFAPFVIPSESMAPTLLPGDFLLVAKWPYGVSRHSLPGALPLPDGRLLPASPARGDIVLFRAPADPKVTYIKRVIALSGERVQMRGGVPVVNGRPLAQQGQHPGIAVEMLANGRHYPVIDLGPLAYADEGPPLRVPVGHIFVLGDNRDRSFDSRLPSARGGGVGMVPEANLVGRASLVLFSVDGSARWSEPISWLRAVRWDRIGLRP